MLLHRNLTCIESRRELSTKPAENFLLIPLYGVVRKFSGQLRYSLTRWNRLPLCREIRMWGQTSGPMPGEGDLLGALRRRR
jgi:hypothetical protein